MTLKDYTDFVIALSRALEIISFLPRFDRIFRDQIIMGILGSASDALNRDLRTMMGDSAWKKFAALFYNKIGCSKDFWEMGHEDVYKNQMVFWYTLAEFCEPLLVKSGEEKGGQDAAKA